MVRPVRFFRNVINQLLKHFLVGNARDIRFAFRDRYELLIENRIPTHVAILEKFSQTQSGEVSAVRLPSHPFHLAQIPKHMLNVEFFDFGSCIQTQNIRSTDKYRAAVFRARSPFASLNEIKLCIASLNFILRESPPMRLGGLHADNLSAASHNSTRKIENYEPPLVALTFRSIPFQDNGFMF